MDTRAALHKERSVEPWPSLTQVFAAVEPQFSSGSSAPSDFPQGLQAWPMAIAAIAQVLKASLFEVTPQESARTSTEICDPNGLLVCGPVPVFSDLALLAHLKTWTFTPEGQTHQPCQLLPASSSVSPSPIATLPSIPLSLADPLCQEQFCLIRTHLFSWVALLSKTDKGEPQFQFSFEPETVHHLSHALALRLAPQSKAALELYQWQQRFPTVAPHYRIPTQFGRELLHQVSHLAPLPVPRRTTSDSTGQVHAAQPASGKKTTVFFEGSSQSKPRPVSEEPDLIPSSSEQNREIELLKALSHEVRTPLATIQTLTRLLLKRSDLPGEVMKRIESIQRECMGQIDRFGLIFKAMELTHEEHQTLPGGLTPICLTQVLADNINRWQTQAARRNLTLDISTPESLPAIAIRDPQLLDQVLTGLMEYLNYSLPMGSRIHLQVALAGPQLKLQLQTQADETRPDLIAESPILKAVGQLLMFQPETGGLSLSLPATKHLFQSLGGKLTVRKHHHGEVLTIFLPLGPEENAS